VSISGLTLESKHDEWKHGLQSFIGPLVKNVAATKPGTMIVPNQT
jgi:hypothetical protein